MANLFNGSLSEAVHISESNEALLFSACEVNTSSSGDKVIDFNASKVDNHRSDNEAVGSHPSMVSEHSCDEAVDFNPTKVLSNGEEGLSNDEEACDHINEDNFKIGIQLSRIQDEGRKVCMWLLVV